MFHKWLAVCGLLAISIPFTFAAYWGWRYRITKDPRELALHRTATTRALACTVLGILCIEGGVRVRPPGHSISALLWMHLPLAAAFFVLLLVLRFWLTGLRSRYHGRLGRLCAAFFVGMLGTGSVLIWQM